MSKTKTGSVSGETKDKNVKPDNSGDFALLKAKSELADLFMSKVKNEAIMQEFYQSLDTKIKEVEALSNPASATASE